MDSYRVNIDNLNISGSCVEVTVTVTGDKPITSPRISACFYSGDNDRILPMDLKQCDGSSAQAIGIFDTPSLFYNDNSIKKAGIRFLFSDDKGQNIMLSPREEVFTPIKKRNAIVRFVKSSRREKTKLLFSLVMSFLFLPYRLMKVKPNRVTFLTNRTDRLMGNIKSVFFEMTKEPELDINVLCKRGGVNSNLPNLFKFFKLYASSSVVFVDDYYHFVTYLKKKKDVTLIQLWHACGAFKTFGFSRLGRDSYLRQSSPNHRQYDYVVVSSKEIVPYYAEGFGVSQKKIIPLGSPRCDKLQDQKYIKYFKRKFYKENERLKDKKLILFAPTFRGGGMGNCHYPVDKIDIDTLLRELGDEWAVMIKMHPYLNERPSYSEENADRVVDFSSGFDINDLLLVSDLLITDYSSVIFEASILNLPMLFFAFDLNEYSRDRDFYCNFASFVPGKIVLSTEEIAQSIKNNDFKQELIPAFRERFFDSNVGCSTQSVVKFTKELLK